MVTYNFMTTDEEFINLIRLIAEFSAVTQTPFWKNVGEVVATFTSSTHLTLLVKDGEGKIEGYLHGYFLTPYEFLISQASHRKGMGNVEAGVMLEDEVKRRGGTKLIALTTLPPSICEKYGFKFERYLLTKYL